MKRPIQGVLGLTLALMTQHTLAADAPSYAISLPLASIGDQLGWNLTEDYRIAVDVEGPVRIDVFSPAINATDYPKDRKILPSYLGDERYAQGSIYSAFVLFTQDGQPIAQRSYSVTQTHDTDTLLANRLPAGKYPLAVKTAGNGKNAFGLDLTGARLEASRFVVNFRNTAKEITLATFSIPQSLVGHEVNLRNYDADGGDVELWLEDGQGHRMALTSSLDREWADNAIPVAPGNTGSWSLKGKASPKSKQFSNSVAFEFLLDGKPFFADLPQKPTEKPQGTVRYQPVVSYCGFEQPLPDVQARIGMQHTPPGDSSFPAGSYTLYPSPVSGLTVNPAPLDLVVQGNTITRIPLVYQAESQLSVSAPSHPLGIGEVFPVTVTLTTGFEGELKGGFQLELPRGLTTTDPLVVQGNLSRGKPLTVTLHVKAEAEVADGKITARMLSNCGGGEAHAPVRTTPNTDLQLTMIPQQAEVVDGETVTYTLKVKNQSKSTAQNVQVQDSLPTGLTFVEAIGAGKATLEGSRFTYHLGDLPAGAAVEFQVKATLEGARNTISNTAVVLSDTPDSLQSNNTSTATVRALYGFVEVNRVAEVCGIEFPLGPLLQRREEKAGKFAFQPPVLPGSYSHAEGAEIQANETTSIDVVYHVQENLTLEAEKVQLSPGEVTTLVATVQTDFPFAVPASVHFTLPDGLEALGPIELQGQVVSNAPLQVRLSVKANKQLSAASVVATLNSTCTRAQLPFTVTEPDQAVQAQTASPAEAVIQQAEVVKPAAVPVPEQQVKVVLQPAVPLESKQVNGASGPAPEAPESTPALQAAEVVSQPQVEAATPSPTPEASKSTPVPAVKAESPEKQPDQPSDNSPVQEVQEAALLTLGNPPKTAVLHATAQAPDESEPVVPPVYEATLTSGSLAATPASLPVEVAQQAVQYSYQVTDLQGTSGKVILAAKGQDLSTDASMQFSVTAQESLAPTGTETPIQGVRHGGFVFWTVPVQGRYLTLKLQGKADGQLSVFTASGAGDQRFQVTPLPEGFMKSTGFQGLSLLQGDPEALSLFVNALREAEKGGDASTAKGSLKVQNATGFPIVELELRDPEGRLSGDETVQVFTRSVGRSARASNPQTVDVVLGKAIYTLKFEPPVWPKVAHYQLVTLLGGNESIQTLTVIDQEVDGQLVRSIVDDSTQVSLRVNGGVVVGYGTPHDLQVSGVATTPVAGGSLTFALDAMVEGGKIGGALTPSDNPQNPFPLAEKVKEGQALASADGVFVAYQNQGLDAGYGLENPEFSGVLGGYQQNQQGLHLAAENDTFKVSAFAGLSSKTHKVSEVRADGTSTYLLPALRGGRLLSETVNVITRDKANPKLILAVRTLKRFEDYTVNFRTGLLSLRGGLPTVDSLGNPLFVSVEYSPADGEDDVDYGVQASVKARGFDLTGTLLHTTNQLAFGAAAGASLGNFSAKVEAMNSGSWAFSGTAAYSTDFMVVRVFGSVKDAGYVDPQSHLRTLQATSEFRASVLQALGSNIYLEGNYYFHNEGTVGEKQVLMAGTTYDMGPLKLKAGSVFELTRTGTTTSKAAFVTGGGELTSGNLRFNIDHRQSIYTNPSDTTFKVDYGLSQNFGVFVQDTFTWGSGNQTALVGVRGTVKNTDLFSLNLNGTTGVERGILGETQFTAALDIGNLQWETGKARFGVDTTIPLSEQLDLSLNAGATVQEGKKEDLYGSVGLDYQGSNLQAGLKAEFSSTPEGNKQVFSARASGSLWRLRASGHARVMGGTSGQGTELGVKLGTDLGWGTLSAAGEYQTGALSDSGKEQFFGNVALDLQSGRIHGGLEGAYLTGMGPQLAGKVSFDVIQGLGLEGRTAYQFSAPGVLCQYGVGLRFEPVTDLVFSAGYNFAGFSSASQWRTEPGLYLEMKVKF